MEMATRRYGSGKLSGRSKTPFSREKITALAPMPLRTAVTANPRSFQSVFQVITPRAKVHGAGCPLTPIGYNLVKASIPVAAREGGWRYVSAGLRLNRTNDRFVLVYRARKTAGRGPSQPVARHSSASCSISIAPDWSRIFRAAFSRLPSTPWTVTSAPPRRTPSA
jgi:hypothetical protein